MAACDDHNKDCMLQRCSLCPGFDNVKTKLLDFEDLNEEISYKQWVSVDRTELFSQSLSISEYINLTITKLESLVPHHYIAHSLSSYLKLRKETMEENSALILMGFAENYAFYVQDEAQGYHWTHHSRTVHPVVCYNKNADNELQHASLCFLSDELQHDVVMVYQIQVKTIQYLKSLMPNLKIVEYLSDGCAAEYKNRKSFFNLCKHQEDFGVEATSHDKSNCDDTSHDKSHFCHQPWQISLWWYWWYSKNINCIREPPSSFEKSNFWCGFHDVIMQKCNSKNSIC